MTSRDVFASACIQLYTRLWVQLQQLTCGQDGALASTQAGAPDEYEILRLEIHLVNIACDTPRWRMLLSTHQRAALKSVLRDLVAFDDGTDADSGQWVAAAQNYLFDAIRDLSAPASSDPEVRSHVQMDCPIARVG
jgi:hypothetical protein